MAALEGGHMSPAAVVRQQSTQPVSQSVSQVVSVTGTALVNENTNRINCQWKIK